MKKTALFSTIALASVALVGTALATMSNTYYLAGDAQSNIIDVTSKITPLADGTFTLSSKGNENALTFKASGLNVDGNGKVISLLANGTIENISPIQNLTKLEVGGETLTVNEDLFNVNYGYCEDVTAASGKIMTEEVIKMGKVGVIPNNPSYFKMTAIKEVNLDNLKISYACSNGGKHSEMPLSLKKFNLTLANSKVKFADGTTVKEFKGGTKLTAEDFDLTSVKDGRTIEAIKTTAGLINFNKFSVTATDSITPLMSPKAGYNRLTLKEGYPNDASKINGDHCSGAFKVHPERLLKGRTSVGNNDLYPQVGYELKYDSNIAMGDGIRIDIHDSKAAKQSSEKHLNFIYTFENKGTTALNFDVYTLNSSSKIKDGSYATTYRVDVDLQPGESKEYSLNTKMGANGGGNRILYFSADKDMANMDFAFTVANKETTEADSTPVPEKAEVEIKTVLPSGYTLKGYNTKALEGDKIVLPTAEQIDNKTGNTQIGWGILKDGDLTVIDSNYVITAQGATLAPIMATTNGNNLICGRHNGKLDNVDNASGANMKNFIPTLTLTKDGFMGRHYRYNGTLKSGDKFRGLTNANPKIEAGHTYKFDFELTNNSNTELKINTYIAQTGMSTSESVASGMKTIAPGATVEFTITIKLNNGNPHVMACFELGCTTSNFDLTIGMIQK